MAVIYHRFYRKVGKKNGQMDYILNIHTATETAIINICEGPKVIATKANSDMKLHAFFLHTAIAALLEENQINANQLKAIGVSHGPGSYTGIRVGLAAAKGLCYALKIPLITFNTLEVMAKTASAVSGSEDAVYCPMIDARRMEVFTAAYDSKIEEIMPPAAVILTGGGLQMLPIDKKIYFFGSGSEKFKALSTFNNAHFLSIEEINTHALGHISFQKYQEKAFSNLSFSEPLYLKEFQSN